MDRTLILVKPDAFARNLTGEIIARFERKGLRIAALRRAQELAGPEGAVVATGSIYLVAELVSAPGTRRASAL